MSGIDALKKYNQFIVWHRESRPDGRIDKVPVNPRSMLPEDAHNPAIWQPFDVATYTANALGDGYGAGFVFTENDPFWFIDIDNCALPDGSGWQPHVHEITQYAPGAAIGVSQSGGGLHVIGSGTAPEDRVCKAGKLFDLYTDKRFVALSGRGFNGDAATDCTPGLASIVQRWLQPITGVTQTGWTTEPVSEWNGPEDDDDLIQRALRSRGAGSIFGDNVTFKQLWEADEEALGKRWPCDHGYREYDYSAADAALAQHLAFWTGNNCERIQILMEQSALNRDKWESRPDYLGRTILVAASKQTKFYRKTSRVSHGTMVIEKNPELRSGFQLLTVSQQLEYFKGCVYVLDLHRIRIPNGRLVKPEQFRAQYGGYRFGLDTANEITTKSAWEAFTESQGYQFPMVTDICFRPQLPPGEIVKHRGLTYVNSYTPRLGAQTYDSVEPFLEHVRRLLPVEADREIYLSYLAACVQKVGTKFQWAPVLQGVQGNGKTIFYSVIEYALGSAYCHQVNPMDMDSRFTAWIEQRLIVCIEEMRMAGRYEMADVLKPLITNRRVPIQGKGADQRTGDNCANFLMFSNHLDAVVKTARDRRYCVLYSAQQSMDDLLRDGLNQVYFRKLFRWLELEGGNAAVAGYLATRPIVVDVLGRAPETSSTKEAIQNSLGIAEQIIMESIELEELGFRGGLIDSGAATRALSAQGKRISPQATTRILNNLEYVSPPALRSSQGKVLVDGIRKRIYVHRMSEWMTRTLPRQIADAWKASNSSEPTPT